MRDLAATAKELDRRNKRLKNALRDAKLMKSEVEKCKAAGDAMKTVFGLEGIVQTLTKAIEYETK